MKLITLIIIFLTLIGCASNTKDRVVAVKVGDKLYKPDSSAAMAIDTKTNEKIVCEKRIVTGSNRKQRSCSTVNQKTKERRAAQETIDSGNLYHSRELIDRNSGGG